MDLHDGCDLSLTRLVSDKFKIDSGGKNPQTRRMESYEKNFSSRMVPHALSFAESNATSASGECESPMRSSLDRYISIHSKKRSAVSSNLFNGQLKSNHSNAKKSMDAPQYNFSPLKSIENTISSAYAEKSGYLWGNESDAIMKSPKFEYKDSFASSEDKENILEISDGSANRSKICSLGRYEKYQNENYSRISDDLIDRTCVFGAKDQFRSRKRDDLLKNINVQYFTSDSGKTPSKFSVVRDRLSPYNVPIKNLKTVSECSLQDYTSRDSGFENSSSLDTGSKSGNASGVDSPFPTLMERFDDYEMEESMTHFDARESTRRLPDAHTPDCDFHALHDLEEEFDAADTAVGTSCSKYEIISTDSPDICAAASNSRVNTIITQNFQFGSPIGDSETSENFNVAPEVPRRMPIRSETTRMLNFDTESTSTSFKFIPPKTLPPKKQETTQSPRGKTPPYNFFSLRSKLNNARSRNLFDSTLPKFEGDSDTIPDVNRNKNARADSGFEGDAISPSVSPLRRSGNDGDSTYERERPSRLFSGRSVESDCVSEMEESLFDLDERCQDLEYDVSMSISNTIQSLIRGQIKTDGAENDHNNSVEKSQRDDGLNKTPQFRRCFSLQPDENSVEKVRTALFQSPGRPRKRTEINDQDGMILSKRRRSQVSQNNSKITPYRPTLQRTISDNEASIKVSLLKAYNEPDLIGDFSRPHCLPLEAWQHSDLKAISSDTLALLIEGGFKDQVDSFKVIDCRYPYEYKGGHIVGAQNLFTEELIKSNLLSNPGISSSVNRRIIIFHCEFSFKRGPDLCRFLRRADRAMNEYPSLAHPELYVLRSGYHGFYTRHGHLCEPTPGAYTSMQDPRYASDLIEHRSATSRRALK